MTEQEYERRFSASRLKQLQSIPLSGKVTRTERKIREWVGHFGTDGVYVAFSGGKDSTVLLHIARSIYPDIPAVFVDTGLEYPEIRDFVKTIDNVTWLRPKMNYKQVVEKYGYPVVSKEQSQCIYELRNHNVKPETREKWLTGKGKKGGRKRMSEKWQYLIDAPFCCSHKCCDVMKKRPSKSYERETGRRPLTGEMCGDSHLRAQIWREMGCNAFDATRPKSTPLSFWTEADIWAYLRANSVPYSKIYDMGYDRTGCMGCMFGVHMEKGENRFQRMNRTHPAQWRYFMDKLGQREILEHIGVPCEPTPQQGEMFRCGSCSSKEA